MVLNCLEQKCELGLWFELTLQTSDGRGTGQFTCRCIKNTCPSLLGLIEDEMRFGVILITKKYLPVPRFLEMMSRPSCTGAVDAGRQCQRFEIKHDEITTSRQA
jgi:hypothetical protein